MAEEHQYAAQMVWTEDRGVRTRDYRAYDHEVRRGRHKAGHPGSSDPGFRGAGSQWNPDELLVAALSQCHMLWYLHRCSVNGVALATREDPSEGVIVESEDGSDCFERITLRPRVTLTRAKMVNNEAYRLCFIANSLNFPIDTEPEFLVSDGPDSSVDGGDMRTVGVEPRHPARN